MCELALNLRLGLFGAMKVPSSYRAEGALMREKSSAILNHEPKRRLARPQGEVVSTVHEFLVMD